MIIHTVKLTDNGFLVNGAIAVPDDQNNRHYKAIQDWIAEGSTPEPEFTAVELLTNAKRTKLDELKREGLSHIQAVIPAITNWDILELVREQWFSTKPTARNATANFQSVIDTYQAGRVAAADINALATVTTVSAYDVVTGPVWP